MNREKQFVSLFLLLTVATVATAQSTRPATAPAPMPVNVTVKAPPVNVIVNVPEAKPKPPVTAGQYLLAGRKAMAEGKLADAIKLFETGRMESPWSLSLIRWLAEAYWADLQAEKAVEMFKHVLRRSVKHPVATRRLAKIRKTLDNVATAVKIAADLRTRKLVAEALGVLENVAKETPVAGTQAGWLIEKARCMEASGNWSGLYVAAINLQRHHPTRAPARLYITALVELGKYDEAARQYKKLTPKKPRTLPWKILLGRIDWGRGRKREARLRLSTALAAATRKPNTPIALLNKARLLAAQWAMAAEGQRKDDATDEADKLAGNPATAVQMAVAVLKSGDASRAIRKAATGILAKTSALLLKRSHFAAAITLHGKWLTAAKPDEAPALLLARGRIHINSAATAYAAVVAAARTPQTTLSAEEAKALADFAKIRWTYAASRSAPAALAEIFALADRLNSRKQPKTAIDVLARFADRFAQDPDRFAAIIRMARIGADMAAKEPLTKASKLSADETAAIARMLVILTATDAKAIAQNKAAMELLMRIANRYANGGALDAAAKLYVNALKKLASHKQADLLRLKLAGVYRRLAAKQIETWNKAGKAEKARNLLDAHAKAVAIAAEVLDSKNPSAAWTVVSQIASEYEARRGFTAARKILQAAATVVLDAKLKPRIAERLARLNLAEGRDVLARRTLRHMGPATDKIETHLLAAVKSYAALREAYPDHKPKNIPATVSAIYAGRGLWSLATKALAAGIEKGKVRKADAEFALAAALIRTREADADAARRRVTASSRLSKTYAAAQAALQQVIDKYGGTPQAVAAMADIRKLSDLHRRRSAWTAAAQVLDAFVKANPKAESTADFVMAGANLLAERAMKEFKPDPQADVNEKTVPTAFVSARKALQAIRTTGGKHAHEAAGGIFRLATFFARQRLWGKAISIFEQFLADNPDYAKPAAVRFQIALCHLGILVESQSVRDLEAFSREVDAMIQRYEQTVRTAAGADPSANYELAQIDLRRLAEDRKSLLVKLERLAGKDILMLAAGTGYKKTVDKEVGEALSSELAKAIKGDDGRDLDKYRLKLNKRLSLTYADKLTEALSETAAKPASPPSPVVTSGPVDAEEIKRLDDLRHAQGQRIQQVALAQRGGQRNVSRRIAVSMRLDPAGVLAAYKVFVEILRKYPDTPQAGRAVARIEAISRQYADRREPNRAADLLARFVKDFPSHSRAEALYLQMANLRLQFAARVPLSPISEASGKLRNAFKLAVEALEGFLKQYPDGTSATAAKFAIARVHQTQAERAGRTLADMASSSLLKAAVAYEQATAKHPRDNRSKQLAAYWISLADQARRFGRPQIALRLYRRTLQRLPAASETRTAVLRIADVYQRDLKRAKTAAQNLLTWANITGDQTGALRRIYSIAEGLRSGSRWSEAIDILEMLVANFPDHAEAAKAQWTIGQIYSDNHLWADALESFQLLANEFAESANAREVDRRIALCHENLSQWLKASDAYRRYTKKVGKKPEVAVRLAVLRRIAKHQELIDDFPNNEKLHEAQFYLAQMVNDRLGNPRKAIGEYGKVVAKYTRKYRADQAQYQIGSLWMALDEFARAREAFEKLVATYPTSERADDALFMLARTYELEADRLRQQSRRQVITEQFTKDQKSAVSQAAGMRRSWRGGQRTQFKQLQERMMKNSDQGGNRQDEAKFWAQRDSSEIELGVNLDNLNDAFARRPVEMTALQVSRLKDRANALLRKAVGAFEQVAAKYAAGEKAPKALLKVAQIYRQQLAARDKAIAAYEKLIAHYSDQSKEAYIEAGRYYQQVRRFEDAIRTYRRFNFSFSGETAQVEEFHYKIGQCLESLSRWTQAIDAYSDYLQKYRTGRFAAKAKERITWIKQYHQ